MTTAIPADHDKISFTAKLVALGRAKTNIPFADEVSAGIGAPAIDDELARESGAPSIARTMAPYVEARYWSLVTAIGHAGVHQVLEFASGVSLRGLAMTLERPDMTYVETDLPGLTAEKRHLVASILERRAVRAPSRHHIAAANILRWEDIQSAIAPFDRHAPLAVVHEGLFMYLSPAEKDIAATHIHSLLERFGGVWITPDFSPIASFASLAHDEQGELERSMAAIEARTGRPFAERSFATDAEARAFCVRHGFVVEERTQIDGSFALTSLADDDGEARLAAMRDHLKLWQMRLP
jgi:O-methyltransferase involved in polyketide biosynthesis